MVWPGAADTALLGGSTDDECRVPRTRVAQGHSRALTGKGRQYPSSLIGGHLSCKPRWRWSEQRGPGLHPGPEGGSVLVAVSLGAGSLKKIWKGTLEQQDGHNNKPDT